MNASGVKDAVAGSSVDRIDALLPQTQCTRCGYPSCREYAEALVAGLVDLNRCPPGGATTIAALALALGLEPRPLDPACGDERPWVVARIDEAVCIGCTLCIQACPVDAILGAAKRMHTVIESECTGCELCLAPCPVDCIALLPTSPGQGLFLQSSCIPAVHGGQMDEVERSRQGLFPTIPCIPAIHGGQMPEPMSLSATDGDTETQRNAKVAGTFLQRWMRERAPLARRRFHARQQRLRRARAKRRRPSPGMDEVERSRQGLFPTIPCIPAIHGGQMPEPTSPGQGLFLQSSCIPAVHGGQMPEPMKRAAMPGRDADRATKQAVIRAAVNRARHRRRGVRES